MRLRLLLLIVSLPACAYASQETSTSATTNETPRGPLIEITPLNGGISTGYLLAMKDGVMEIESPSGEIKQEKTSAIKSIRFIPPAAPTTPLPAPALVEKDKIPPAPVPPIGGPNPPRELTPLELKKREEHRHFLELLRKERAGTKLTPDEEKELTDFQDRIPGIKFLGGLAFARQAHTADADAKLELSRGKLDTYIVQHRQSLKDATTDMDARVQILRLACAYKAQNIHVVKLIEQLTKDIDQVAKETVREHAHNQLQNLLDVLYVLNGEKPPK